MGDACNGACASCSRGGRGVNGDMDENVWATLLMGTVGERARIIEDMEPGTSLNVRREPYSTADGNGIEDAQKKLEEYRNKLKDAGVPFDVSVGKGPRYSTSMPVNGDSEFVALRVYRLPGGLQ